MPVLFLFSLFIVIFSPNWDIYVLQTYGNANICLISLFSPDLFSHGALQLLQLLLLLPQQGGSSLNSPLQLRHVSELLEEPQRAIRLL